MEERIQKIISASNGISRRKAEGLISEGRVFVNGNRAVLGGKADADLDEIEVDGVPIPKRPVHKIYIMLNKPAGYVTTLSDEKGRRTVRELVSDIDERIYPIGRLDINSEGLLLMTNDGEFANIVMHPSYEKEKTYEVSVTGDIEKGVRVLSTPLEIDGSIVTASEVKVLRRGVNSGCLSITIHEGKNRQIRRMCDMAGLYVERLIRVSEGGVKLGRLKSGSWRYLSPDEVSKLRRSK